MFTLGTSMVLKLVETPLISAAFITMKNLLVMTGMQVATGFAALTVGVAMPESYTVEGITMFVGPRAMAMLFACISAIWRWHRFQLSARKGLSGCALGAVLAFIIGDGQIPYAEVLTKNIARESVPMMNGFLMGLFGLLLVTGAQDFISEYRRVRKVGGE